MNMLNRIMRSAMPLALLLLAACNGGGGGAAAPAAVTTTSYTVGGTVSGLTGSVVLQNNNSGSLTSVTANGVFTFPSQNASGSLYSVSVFSQPTGQTCSVSTGAGTISGNNVSNVAVVCATNAYNVGGNVTGLTGSVVLQDNSGDNLTVAANGVYTFATNVANGSPYSVTVLTQPSATMSCSVANGTGTISLAAVTNVTITCAANSYTVGGTATGLNGSVVLQDNGADNLTVSVNGPFNFPTAVFYNNPYSVSILTQSAMQSCSVNMGAGTATANVGNVALSCISLLGGAVKNVVPSLAAASATPVVSTFAGTASRNLDGTGGTARFNGPTSSVSDGTNLYVADINNHEIRQIVIATGAVSTLPAAGLNNPVGIATDGTNLYVADMYNGRIAQVVISSGAVTTLAGYGYNSCCTIVNGTGGAASFYYPTGITTDGTSLYVADMYDNAIRKITPATGTLVAMTSANAVVTTLAGSGPYGYGNTDGTGTAATFGYPQGITTDGTNVYVADTRNSEIRQVVIASGVVTTLAGQANVYGAADGTGKAATFNYPIGITAVNGNLYVDDTNNNIIRQIVTATGAVTTLAGAKPGADGTGALANFSYPGSTTTDGTNLYVADSGDNTIRQIVIATGAVTTLAGKAGEYGSVDGIGAEARFNYPSGITTDGTSLYVTDNNNCTIRQIVIASGAVTTLAGRGTCGSADGIGAEALFNYPMGITTDGTNLYVADSNNSTIRQIVIATRAVTTLAGQVNVWSALDGAGTAATFNYPTGITTDGANLYVADSNNQKIRQIVISSGVVTTLAGTGGYGSTDGAGVTTATFSYPGDITTDGTNLYVTNSNYNDIRQIVIATGVVSTLAGSIGSSSGSADGAALTTATFSYPYGITSDGQSLYVTDSNNGTIRKIQ